MCSVTVVRQQKIEERKTKYKAWIDLSTGTELKLFKLSDMRCYYKIKLIIILFVLDNIDGAVKWLNEWMII